MTNKIVCVLTKIMGMSGLRIYVIMLPSTEFSVAHWENSCILIKNNINKEDSIQSGKTIDIN